MMYVDRTMCDGCGACLDICPEGAISMQDDRAFIAVDLCAGCAVCQSICPQDAIMPVEVIEPAVAGQTTLVPVPQPGEIVTVQPHPAKPSLRESVLPAIGSALLWTGREIIPRLASLALNSLDRNNQMAEPAPLSLRSQAQIRTMPGRGSGQGRRRQRRRRSRNR